MGNNMDRRTFISSAVKTGASLSLGATLFNLSGCTDNSIPRAVANLMTDPKGICDLPDGFTYKVISMFGETMSDGHTVPDYHDGMGCFSGPNGEIILVRNHEIPLYFPFNDESPEPDYAYDPDASGGTTTIWLNHKLEVIRQYLSLTGTIRNCSGGTTPWGTWISSEEANEGWMMGKRHGYNFEVDPLNPLRLTNPLKAMGRFNHEAVAVDPASGIVYQTEDNTNGCFYRFIPNRNEQLDKGGVLQALKFVGENNRHTSEMPLQPGQHYPVEWVTVDEPDPEDDTVHLQAQQKGAAIFVRGEGAVAHSDGLYFSCTTGGADNIGQIFKHIPDNDNGGSIELVFEARQDGLLNKPDNLSVNQWGDLIICEDNNLNRQCLLGLTPQGKIYPIAANSQSEWSGVCFSPDGSTLFANIHKKPGMTLAIRGPWQTLRELV